MSLDQIEHFVVLMLENRSFDHIFGLRPGVDGILGKKLSNAGPDGRAFAAAGGAPFSIPTKHGKGPFHNLADVNLQLFGSRSLPAGDAPNPTMDGFAKSYVEALQSDTQGAFTSDDVSVVMKSFEPADLPSIHTLADQFVLCDKWFCEVPGPTHPNRLYMHAGTSAGFVHNVFKRPFDLLTIYELLERNGKTWAVYDFDLNEVKLFTRIAESVSNFRRFSPNFQRDAETSRLPNYSFVIPRFTSTPHSPSTDQHPPGDIRWGEQLIADVYDAIRANEAVWQKSALFVTYDEHGGFFDHVPPPATVSPDGIDSPRPDDNFGKGKPPAFHFNRLGARVPCVVVSPWVAKGQVVSNAFRHTSILKTVRERFGIQQPLSAREAEAPTLRGLFNQPKPRSDAPKRLARPIMPALPAPDHHANPGNQFPDTIQREMLEGVFRATRASHPEDEDSAPTVPSVQRDVAELVQRRWSRHAKWLGS